MEHIDILIRLYWKHNIRPIQTNISILTHMDVKMCPEVGILGDEDSWPAIIQTAYLELYWLGRTLTNNWIY